MHDLRCLVSVRRGSLDTSNTSASKSLQKLLGDGPHLGVKCWRYNGQIWVAERIQEHLGVGREREISDCERASLSTPPPPPPPICFPLLPPPSFSSQSFCMSVHYICELRVHSVCASHLQVQLMNLGEEGPHIVLALPIVQQHKLDVCGTAVAND